jgi:hypothetical protein
MEHVGVSKRKNPNPKRSLSKLLDPNKKRHIKLSEQVKLFQLEIAQLNSIILENKARETATNIVHTDLDFGTFVDALKFPTTITITFVVNASFKCIYRAFLDTHFDSVLDDVTKMYKLDEIAIYAEIECKTRILCPKNMQCARLTEMFSNNDYATSNVTIFICNATPILFKL